MRSYQFLPAVLAAMIPLATGQDVVAHYMAQTLSADHAAQDVQRALSLGISAFALNVGNCDASWCKNTVQRLFDAASSTDFKLFFSLDLYAQPDPNYFTQLVNDYSLHASYYRAGPDSAPMLSTFLDAGWSPDQWNTFLSSLQSKPYFVPNFDQAQGYYSNPTAFWDAWQNTLDGSFSWEQSWPGTSDTHSNVSTALDEKVMQVAHARSRTYMMGLSSLQFKNFQGSHWFRAGDIVLPERMEQILALDDRPEFVQIQTWNDAGESHYIGTLRHEGLTPEILEYANQDEHPHEGWQPLVASFAEAFKTGVDASAMRPRNGAKVAGAMWHHEFLTATGLAGCPSGQWPAGSGAARDAINWAVVVGDDLANHFVQVWSGGKMIAHDPISPGLNYKSVPGVAAGEQHVQVVDGSGTVIAEGGKGTKGIHQSAQGLCNYNFQVAELVSVAAS